MYNIDNKFLKKLASFTLVLMLLLSSFSLSACTNEQERGSDGDTSGSNDSSSSVIVAMSPSCEPSAGFDPAYGWGAGEHVHEPLIQSTLTITTNDLGIAYDLATDLSVSEDGLLWSAKIRDDVYFTNGEKLTAFDVAFTYNIVKEKSTVSDFTMLDYAQAKDETTVLFYLNKPYSILPYSMSNVGIVPEHSYSEEYGLSPIGSGKYIMKQWDKGQQVIFEANPNYYGEKPNIERLVIVFMSEDAAFAAIKAGQVDVAYTSSAYASQEIAGYHILSVQSVDNRGINLPSMPLNGSIGNDITADINIRKAINIGIDREKLIDNVLKGHGSPAYSVCDGLPWAYADVEASYDLDAAKALLDASGWLLGSDGIRSKDGIRASLNIMYPSGDSDRQALAAEVANQLKLLGIEATSEGVGWDVAYDRAKHEPLLWGWGAHTPMELYNIYHTAYSDSSAENSGSGSSDSSDSADFTASALYSPYSNPEADRLMDEALSANDLETSYELWQEAQKLIYEDMPWVWLVNIDHLYWVSDDLSIPAQKIHPHGHGFSIVNNADTWTYN